MLLLIDARGCPLFPSPRTLTVAVACMLTYYSITGRRRPNPPIPAAMCRLLFAAAAAAALSMLAAHARTLSATLSLEEAAAAARERATTRTTGSGGPSTTPIRSTASAVCTASSFVRPFAALADNYTAASAPLAIDAC